MKNKIVEHTFILCLIPLLQTVILFFNNIPRCLFPNKRKYLTTMF